MSNGWYSWLARQVDLLHLAIHLVWRMRLSPTVWRERHESWSTLARCKEHSRWQNPECSNNTRQSETCLGKNELKASASPRVATIWGLLEAMDIGWFSPNSASRSFQGAWSLDKRRYRLGLWLPLSCGWSCWLRWITCNRGRVWVTISQDQVSTYGN